jgi:hypothetical protein
VKEPKRRTGYWAVAYKWGDGTFWRKKVSDDKLLSVLADRYGIVNHVTYFGPEVEETNRYADALIAKDKL